MTDRTSWLTWRATGLGASDIAAVAGIPGAYGSPWSVWASKVGLGTDQADNPDMEFGRYAEPMVAKWVQDKLGLYVIGQQTWCTKPDEPWCLATPDGFLAESPNSTITDALGGLEIKTARDSWADGPPAHYRAQCQWQMMVTGLDHWWLACYHRTLSGDPFSLHEITRDDSEIGRLYAAARTFWLDHVCTGIAPPADSLQATTEALAAAWPDPTDDTLEADDDLAALVGLLGARKAEAKALDAKVTELENRVKAALADRTTLTHGTDDKGRARVLATWKPQLRSGIDTAALRIDLPYIAAKYTNASTSRVLRLKAGDTR